MTDAQPYTVPKERGSWRAILLAALVHLALIAFLWIGVRWQNETPVTIEAEVWSPQVKEAAPTPPAPEPREVETPPPVKAPPPKAAAAEPPPPPPPPKAEPKSEPKPDIALAQEKKRKEEEKRRKEEEREAEERKRIAKLKEEKEKRLVEEKRQEEREKEKRLAEQKRQEEREKEREKEKRLAEQKEKERKHLEEERLAKAKEAEEKKRAEKEKAEKAEKARLAAEKKRKDQEEAENRLLAKARDEEMRRITGGVAGTGGSGDAPRSQGAGRADAEYASRVGAKIKSNINYNVPDDMSGNTAVEYQVNLLPDGSVAGMRKIKSSGVPGFDEAVRRAIEKAQPYPKDKSGAVPSSFIGIHKPKDQ